MLITKAPQLVRYGRTAFYRAVTHERKDSEEGKTATSVKCESKTRMNMNMDKTT